jgi:hypothetical protein
MPVKGTYLAIAGGGIILLWSGLAGKKWSDVLRQVIAGKNPTATTSAYVINSPAGSAQSGILSGEVNTRNLPKGGNAAANQAAAQIIAARYGWVGKDWEALKYGWGTLESGFNSLATNPSSGAFGIAQALGHGTATTRGSITNEYGNFGTSNAICKAANSGNGPAQIIWGCNYIKQTYGRPSNIPGWLGQGGYSGY